MKKKIISLLLVLTLAGSMLAGCGGNQEAEGDGSGSKPGSNSGDSSDGVIELTLWSTYGTYGSQYLDDLIDEFNESQDKYYLTSAGGYDSTTLRTKMESTKVANYPSLITGNSTMLGSYGEAAYVAPLQDFIDADDEDWTSGIFSAVKNCYIDNKGSMIGWPVGVSCNGYIVNVDILKQAGYSVDDLTSFERIVEIATEAVNKGLCKYGLSFYNGIDILDMLVRQGVDVVDADNGFSGDATQSLLLEGDTYETLTRIVDLISGMYVDGVALEYGYNGLSSSLFKSNDLLFWKCTNSSVHNVLDSGSGMDWVFIQSVAVDGSAQFPEGAISEGTGIYICDTGDEEEMQGAYEFIKFLSRAENQCYFAEGIGYLPYTEEAAELYQEWAEENFPSSIAIVEELTDSPEELKLPYTAVIGDIITAFAELIGNISVTPEGNLESFMEDANISIEAAFEIYLRRNQ